MAVQYWNNAVRTTIYSTFSSGVTSSCYVNNAAAPWEDPADPNGAGEGLLMLTDSLVTPTVKEIIKYTNRTDLGSYQQLTGIVRAQEGTSDLSWSVGDIVVGPVTAGQLSNFLYTGEDGILADLTFDTLTSSLGGVIRIDNASIADDATQTFTNFYSSDNSMFMISVNGSSWYSVSAIFTVIWGTGSVGVAYLTGANDFNFGLTSNPDVDGDLNLWISGGNTINVKNRLGATRKVTIMQLSYA